MDEESIISELIILRWSRGALEVWRRAKHHCEYCNKSLLDSADEYFYGSHIDHVVPSRGDNLDNYALACKTCNYIKRNKDFAGSENLLTRLEVIAKAKAFILERRKENDMRLERVKSLLNQLPLTA